MNLTKPALRTVQVTRYVLPLREGGSLPAIVEADDGFLYALKFKGAGQGSKALIADLIGGELARVAGLKVPEIVFAELDEAFGRTEPDEEIQDLLKASVGLNLGLHYLSGSITYDPAVKKIDSLLASKIVWLDAFLFNIDRTARNTNMLYWQHELWLIDHGATLYFHHAPENWQLQAVKAFSQIKDHVLLAQAGHLEEAHEFMKKHITLESIAAILELIPEIWLTDENMREIYFGFLSNRLAIADQFLEEIKNARKALI